jgi:hypothetical protein
MGTFFTEAQLASPARPTQREIVKLLVDSGSLYTWVSAAVLRDLGVHPTERRRLLTIKGRTLDRGAAEVLITLEGRTLVSLAPTRWRASGWRSIPFRVASSPRSCTARQWEPRGRPPAAT